MGDYNTYLLICLGVFVFLLLIRVLFLRKKRRYLTIEELAQSEAALSQKKGKKKKEKPAKVKEAAAQEKAPQSEAPQAPAPAGDDTDLFGDID